MNINLSTDPLELKKFLDDALEANRLAINELNRQRDALYAALNGQRHQRRLTMKNAPSNNEASSGTSALDDGLGEWVCCAERMPERWESVLLALGGMVPLGTFVWTGERWQVGVSDTQYPYRPEFWMPMPKAPNVKVTGAQRHEQEQER